MATEIIIRDEALRQNAIDVLASLDLSRPYVMQVKRYVKKRTLSQNNLMWMWLNQVADLVSEHTGYDAEDIHEFCKRKFLPASGRVAVLIGGEYVERLTTTKMTTLEMSAYMNAIDAWASMELGLVLPHPVDLHRR